MHEQIFSAAGIAWPPPQEKLQTGWRAREAEMIFLADQLFPPQKGFSGRQYFDANHSAERVFKCQPKSGNYTAKNPWKRKIPTFTGQTAMVMRLTDEYGKTRIRGIHPIEGFGLIGWDLSMFKDRVFLSC